MGEKMGLKKGVDCWNVCVHVCAWRLCDTCRGWNRHGRFHGSTVELLEASGRLQIWGCVLGREQCKDQLVK